MKVYAPPSKSSPKLQAKKVGTRCVRRQHCHFPHPLSEFCPFFAGTRVLLCVLCLNVPFLPSCIQTQPADDCRALPFRARR